MPFSYPDPAATPYTLAFIPTLLQWQGGVIQLILVELVIVLAFSVLMISISVYVEPDAVGGNGAWHAYKVVFDVIAERMKTAVGLMLGFFTTTAYGRWSEVRAAQGNFSARVADLAAQIATNIRDTAEREPRGERSSTVGPTKNAVDGGDDGSMAAAAAGDGNGGASPPAPPLPGRAVRDTLLRWIDASHAILVMTTYEGKHHALSTPKMLECWGLLTKEERIALEGPGGPLEQMEIDGDSEGRLRAPAAAFTYPLVWVSSLVHRLCMDGAFGADGFFELSFDDVMGNARGAGFTLQRLRATPVPLAYVQLVNLTVRLYVIIVALAPLDSIANPPNETYYFYLLVPLFEVLLFVGWANVANVLMNPFRRYPDGIDWPAAAMRSSCTAHSIANHAAGFGILSDEEIRAQSGMEFVTGINAKASSTVVSGLSPSSLNGMVPSELRRAPGSANDLRDTAASSSPPPSPGSPSDSPPGKQKKSRLRRRAKDFFFRRAVRMERVHARMHLPPTLSAADVVADAELEGQGRLRACGRQCGRAAVHRVFGEWEAGGGPYAAKVE